MGERNIRDTSYLIIGLQLAAVSWLLPVAGLSLVLLYVADTWMGRVFAIAALLLAALPLAVTIAWSRRTKSWNRRVVTLLVTFCVLLAVLVANVTRVMSPSIHARVTEQFTGEPSLWLRYSPTNLVPEGDQLLFDFTLMAAVDPILTARKAKDLKRMTAELYREQAQDPQFAGLGSSMPDAYAELFGFRPESGHAFVYVPTTIKADTEAPMLVFFHGSGGNFKVYLWELSALAERLGFVLVAPSSGMGNWRGNQSQVALESALTAAGRAARIDPTRVHLLGLSNGGRAVSQLAGARGRSFRSATFLSPVFDAVGLEANLPSVPMLVVTGAWDDRTPLAYIEETVGALKRSGGKVELHTVADADHFLIFTHRAQVIKAVASWLTQLD